MLTWINAGCDVGLGLPKCQAMHPTSVLGQTQTSGRIRARSVLPPTTDMMRLRQHVRLVPIRDSSTAVSVIVAGLTRQGRNWPRHGKKQTSRKYEE